MKAHAGLWGLVLRGAFAWQAVRATEADRSRAALLTDILDILHGSSAAAKDRHLPPPAEGLSPGELRVLRYLPTNLSRPQIASELSVSPNTVGTHIRSIYAKLGVRDRSSAVQRARELRLLAPTRTANHRN